MKGSGFRPSARMAGLVAAGVTAAFASTAHAQHEHHHGHDMAGDHAAHHLKANARAPVGVMGDHMAPKGNWMLSYRFMHMAMEGNRIGTDSVTPETIATTVPNPNAPPPTLRVVPTRMPMNMHMFGAMYGVTDWLTVMLMGMYIDKEMDHTTFMGGMGANVLGGFTTRSGGFGDIKLSGLIRLFEEDGHHIHLNAGISLPTGGIDETDDVLTPMGTMPVLTLPYPMQTGSGTWDLLPGITYTGSSGAVGWGAQYRATFRLDTNDAGYSLGDAHHLTAWASYGFADWISASLRLAGRSIGRIDGRDARIAAPVQTAVPGFHGGERLDIGVGVNLAGQDGFVKGQRVAVEFVVPVVQDLNGPQMETDWSVTVGWQYAF